MERNILCNEQLAKCKQLFSSLNRKRCNGRFRDVIALILRHIRRSGNAADAELLTALAETLEDAVRQPPVTGLRASLLLGNAVRGNTILRALLRNSAYSRIQEQVIRTYVELRGRRLHRLMTVLAPVERGVKVLLADTYTVLFPQSELDNMCDGQVFPCGHVIRLFSKDGGLIDSHVSYVHCYLVRRGDSYELYDCSLNGTHFLLS